MYKHRRIELFYNVTCSLAVIFFLIGLSHGFEVHTHDEVQAEYRGSTTLSCWYTPTSSTSSDFYILWAKGEATLIYINGGGKPVKMAERYDLEVDYRRSGNLTINDVQLDDEGRYTCEVIPGLVAIQSHVNLRVVAEPDELVLSSRTGSTQVAIQQGAVTLKPGLETTFVCEAIGSRPAVAIEWDIDGVPLETAEETPTPNSQDGRLQDTTSSFVITDPGQFRQGQSLTCRAIREGKMVRNTSIVINVEKPPGNSVAIIGLDDRITSSTKQTPSCIAQDSLPASQITWSLGGESVTDNAESTTEEMTSGMMTVSSALEYIPSTDDDGKILQCRVSHVTLEEDIVAEKAICLSDSEMKVTVEQEHPFSLLLKLSGIPHSASCNLSACYVERGSNLQRSCIPRDLGDMYSDTFEHEYEFRDLVSSPSYKIVLNLTCHHSSCGDRTVTTDTDVATISTSSVSPVNMLDSESMTSSTDNVWIRDLIFVIIAVIVVSGFVIVVTVSVVLRAVVKKSIRAAKAQVDNHVTTSPDRASDTPRSSILSSWSNNLYTIEEGNEGESKIYHEIKESRTSLVEPSDILVSTLPNSQQRYTARLSMRHPRPPPLPPPINRLSLDPAVLAAATDSSDTESDRDEYVPMSPDTYSIDSDYMAMNSANKN